MYNSYAICAPRCIALLFIYAPTYVNESIIWKYLPLRRIRYAYGTPCDSLLLTVLVQFFLPRSPHDGFLVRLFPFHRKPDLSSWSLSFVVPARAFVPPSTLFLTCSFVSSFADFPPRSPAEIAKRVHFAFTWAQAMCLPSCNIISYDFERCVEKAFDRLYLKCLLFKMEFSLIWDSIKIECSFNGMKMYNGFFFARTFLQFLDINYKSFNYSIDSI